MVDAKLSAISEDLNKALRRLEEALALPKTEINRDATIQRFEFTFELTWKLLKATNEVLGTPCYSPRDCIRSAARNGVLDNPEKWLEYLTGRNLVSHTYDEALAEEVYALVKNFPPDCRKLLNAAQAKIH